MPHGGPDWGTAGPLGTVFTLEDMAEMVARLGSIVTFDRRGNVIWLDDFENGIEKWKLAGGGVGYALTWESAKARNGAFSAKLKTAPTEEIEVSMQHYFTFPVLSRMGFEFSFTSAALMRYIDLHIYILTGTTKHEAEIMWLKEDHFFYCVTPAPDWIKLTPSIRLLPYGDTFHTIKLVIDLTTGKYVRLLANHISFDLSSLSYQLSDVVGDIEASATIAISTDADDNAISYIDDVILTQNEP